MNKDQDRKLDYSKIKEEFQNACVAFPLKEEECVGLSLEELKEINPCGTYCGKCEDYGVVCDGCRNRNGYPIWYHLYAKEKPCDFYTCTVAACLHNCSQCQKVPCNKFFEYPDPNMEDEWKQMWFRLRMENFNQRRSENKIEVKGSYQENEETYKREY